MVIGRVKARHASAMSDRSRLIMGGSVVSRCPWLPLFPAVVLASTEVNEASDTDQGERDEESKHE